MSILHFKFVPHIEFMEPDEDGCRVATENKIYPTGDKVLDELLLSDIVNDVIEFRKNFYYVGDSFHYNYDPTDGFIHIWTKTHDGNAVTSQDLKEELESLDPTPGVGGGIDGWMSGRTDIGSHGDYDLIPIISSVSYLIPELNTDKYTEYQVDLSRL